VIRWEPAVTVFPVSEQLRDRLAEAHTAPVPTPTLHLAPPSVHT
jgi:hypothetical protein